MKSAIVVKDLAYAMDTERHSPTLAIASRTVALLLMILTCTLNSQAAEYSLAADATSAPQNTLVIGFVGGFIKHDNLVHSEVQLAARLRKAYPAGVEVETFESYNGRKALTRVLALLNTNHEQALTPEEKSNARIILYGHSWGASEAINLARKLEKRGIPVLLTIQVDSVAKIHQDDATIPANVSEAINFYQTNGHLHGRASIHAADPARTRILGNFRYDYRGSAYNCRAYPWYDRIFSKAHTQIECDPTVWDQVESLINKAIPPA